MSKNAEGWIRHRGGKCPVEKGTRVDVRIRNGATGCAQSEHLTWDHYKNDSDIMAYRLHKPAEQDIIKELDDAISIASDGNQSAMAKAIHERAAEYGLANLIHNSKAVEGPLQWRDRITEIDATTQALTAERAELVQKLASEGFALIGRVVEPVEDMSDWRNWKAGDYLKVINAGTPYFAFDDIVKVTKVFNSAVGAGECESIDGGIEGFWNTFDMKFHSRPSA